MNGTERAGGVESESTKWIIVAGARPNFMKIAPLIRAVHAFNRKQGRDISPFLVHTGQHYDAAMSESFFTDLQIPAPDVYLGVGSGTHGEQTGKVLIEFERVLLRENPDLVIVVGDVNSTVACALAAAKLHIPVAHVEAGLRSFDRLMPEEINRVVTDALSDYLFTPSPDGDENLLKEGISPEKIFLVGDIMVDSLLFNLEKAKGTPILKRLSLANNSTSSQSAILTLKSTIPYALLTLHRPSNVDDRPALLNILSGLKRVSSRIPVIFPMHPRTRKQVECFALQDYFEFHSTPDLTPRDYQDGTGLKNRVHSFDPLGYLDFLNVMAHATVVLTDSGGIQEETTVLKIPCITLRDTTERPITLTQGTNVLVGNDPERLVEEVEKVLHGKARTRTCPKIWDGHTAERIIKVLADSDAVS